MEHENSVKLQKCRLGAVMVDYSVRFKIGGAAPGNLLILLCTDPENEHVRIGGSQKGPPDRPFRARIGEATLEVHLEVHW